MSGYVKRKASSFLWTSTSRSVDTYPLLVWVRKETKEGKVLSLNPSKPHFHLEFFFMSTFLIILRFCRGSRRRVTFREEDSHSPVLGSFSHGRFQCDFRPQVGLEARSGDVCTRLYSWTSRTSCPPSRHATTLGSRHRDSVISWRDSGSKE